MGLLGRLIKEGWWEKGEQGHRSIDIAEIPQENIEELYRNRTTVIDQEGASYIVSIPPDIKIPDLRPSDFRIVEVPKAMAAASAMRDGATH